MACSCKKNTSTKQPSAIKQVVKTTTTTPRIITRPATKRVIIRRPI